MCRGECKIYIPAFLQALILYFLFLKKSKRANFQKIFSSTTGLERLKVLMLKLFEKSNKMLLYDFTVAIFLGSRLQACRIAEAKLADLIIF